MKLVIFCLILLKNVHSDDNFQYENWKFHFLPGTGMGVFLAVALPLDLPNKNAYLAYNFEANYMVPDNQTSLEYPPLIQRSIDRNLIYSALETKMQSNGYSGRSCLLRTICEVAVHSTKHVNGVLGDIFHVIFTPSTSQNDNLDSNYENAENHGRDFGDCSIYNKNCTVNFLDLISWIGYLT